MNGGGKTKQWLHLCCKPLDQCDSKLGIGKSELKASVSKRGPNALRATCILSYSAAKVRVGVQNMI